MFAKLTEGLDFQAKALSLRSDRQRLIASNIANVDTPGYVGRDIDFKQALQESVGANTASLARIPMLTPHAAPSSDTRHFALEAKTAAPQDPNLAYTIQSQPALDGNSVDIDRERASFVDNTVRYEAALRFINGYSKTILSAIQGQ